MLSFLTLDGSVRSTFAPPSRKPLNIIRLTSTSQCASISDPASLLPTFADSLNGIPPIPSFLTYWPWMMVYLGMAGCRLLQVYGSMDSELVSGYPMMSEHDLPSTLQDFIHDYGTMEGLKSNNSKSETSFAMKDLFWMYLIKDCQSEPHYQHQNPIECHIQDLKQMMHGIMDHVASPLRVGCCVFCMSLVF